MRLQLKKYIYKQSDMLMEVRDMKNIDKFRGCLVGGAAGDALGYAVEFMDENRIFSKYGVEGITEYDLTNGKALISDDTQMTLFTANGLLYGTTRGRMRGIMASYSDYIAIMYQCWYRTQTEKYPIENEYKHSWLLNVPELFNLRAPGNTCLSAIRNINEGKVPSPINNSKGCGGVMRVAPIGLYFADKNISFDESDTVGSQAASITHGHELGYIPAATLVHVIRRITENPDCKLKDAVTEAIEETVKLFSDAKNIGYYADLMNKAVELAYSDKSDLDAIHQLGEGWVAEETLAIAVFCALRYEDNFDKALICSVNHNGDSDSTGAVTGNILGAYIGYDAIPQKYKDNLELVDLILSVADDLYNDCQISEYSSYSDEVWEQKYIEASYKM